MKALFLSTAALTFIGLSSCNTFVGVGRDFKSLGQGVENKAYGNTWNGQQRAQNSQQSTVPQTTIPQP
ncbi:hypothetical protein [Rubritalea sp.]|uniref:hypothetical protein n=1 Tax=Rubritalea sp. TaxID=2109375 RepID=UPI003EF31A52